MFPGFQRGAFQPHPAYQQQEGEGYQCTAFQLDAFQNICGTPPPVVPPVQRGGTSRRRLIYYRRKLPEFRERVKPPVFIEPEVAKVKFETDEPIIDQMVKTLAAESIRQLRSARRAYVIIATDPTKFRRIIEAREREEEEDILIMMMGMLQ